MKKHLLFLFAALLPMLASAQTKVEVDGIWYNLITKGKVAEVTSKSSKYSGSITIPATVTYEGVNYSVTSIGDRAFEDCYSLTSITIPEGVTSIGYNAFYGCSRLTAITIPEGVTSIGSSAFSYCRSLTAINIPEGVTSIGSEAFRDCLSLTAITLPEGVTSIGTYAFCDCSSLTAITLPESVTSIGDDAFHGCSSLTAITLPEGVTSIGERAFSDCSSLTAITIPEGVTSFGSSAFCDCSSLTSILVAEENKVYDSRSGCNAIIETASNTLVAGCSTTIIPESVTSIGERAFEGCSSLTAITLPEGVTSIGYAAFAGCWSLTTITIPESLTSIGEGAFWYCSSLTSITIPEGVTSIGYSAFGGTSWYNNQPDGIVYVGNILYHYKGTMPQNTSIEVREGTVSISPKAFEGCSSLTAINIPEGVTSIGSFVFRDCSSLTAINIPEGVTSIGNYAFWDCSSLTSITLPESLTSIGENAFRGCSSLTSITLPESVTSIGDCAFYGCSSLTAITLPEGVTSIGKGAFDDCSSLTAINIPEGVTSIEQYAFAYCSSLTTIVLPKSVKNVGSYAFVRCPELTDVYCHAETVPSTEADAFEECYPEYATLHVPASALNAYKSTEPWSSFGTILPLDGDQPAEEGWSEWNHLGTAVTASGKESMIATFQYWGTESVVAWDEPITIDQRTNVADPTKHQLRLNDIFNGKDIILDYDSSTGKISAEQQSTGYATNKELMVEQSGWSDFYDEFMFALDYTTGSYNPLTGTIDLSKAFFHVSDPSVQMFYFNLGFTLQIEGVTPPTFTYAWDRTYVGRGECEATLTVTFEEPIVKYRKLVIAPGETVYVYQLEELYKANPETDLEYEDTDQPTTTITCDQIGIYRVLLIPLGADGTAVMDYMLARMVSYAEPDYDSYTWNYIGTSTVIEAMGSNLIPNEEAWEEVDGIWVNKYPWTVEVEGVQTYRRADNPNIIGLRNLYGENHPYSSMFQFIDQSQDWWVYIDVTNPEDVRLLTTPVGATSSNDGYASFISHYAEANAAATYTDGVITFPFFSVLLGNIVNQEQVAEFDFKVILPEEETMPMEAITINQYGSGTYCSEYALDFSNVEGLKAYAATGYNSRTGVVTLTRVMTTQPGEGLFIKGEPGTYKVPVIEEADDNSLNMLVGTLTETAVNAYSTDGLYANYKYTIKEGDSQPLFYQFADGSTLGAGKAYLQIPVAWLPQTSETKSISLRFDEGEGTTDIEDSEFTIHNSQLIYDLYGRRVDNPVKGGIYIVGGKKVVVK